MVCPILKFAFCNFYDFRFLVYSYVCNVHVYDMHWLFFSAADIFAIEGILTKIRALLNRFEREEKNCEYFFCARVLPIFVTCAIKMALRRRWKIPRISRAAEKKISRWKWALFWNREVRGKSNSRAAKSIGYAVFYSKLFFWLHRIFSFFFLDLSKFYRI